MEDLTFSFHTVLPLLFIMAAGLSARRLGWLADSAIRQINDCVFRLFLPILLCFHIMDADIGTAVDGITLIYALAATLVCFSLMFMLAPLLTPKRSVRGVLIQGIARSNYAIFGIPLVSMMYPGRDAALAAMMVAVAVPVYNIMSTIALMAYGTRSTGWKQIAMGILRNPLIGGTAAGFLLWRLQVRLPDPLNAPLRQLAGIATPLALFSLGASLNFQKAKTNARLLVVSVMGRLIIVPLVFLSIAVAIGIRDVSLAVLIALFASPLAVSSYPMAQQMGGDEDLAAAQVVFSTAFSILTVFLWVYAFKSLGFLG